MVVETEKKAWDIAAEAAAKAKKAAEATIKKAGEVVDNTKAAVVDSALTEDQKKIAQKMGMSGASLTYFDKESDANKELGQIFKNLEKEMANSAKYDKLLGALGTRFKDEAKQNAFDTDKDTIIDLIGRDIKKNPALGKQLEAALKENPDKLADRLAGYKQGELASVLTELKAPEVKKDPAVSVAAAAAAVTATPAAPTPAKPVEPKRAAAAPQAAPPVAAAAAVTQPAAPAVDPVDALIQDIIDNDGEALNNIVKNSVDAKAVVGIADKMAKVASEKYGVPTSTSSGFADRVAKDKSLAASIAQNFQNNPEFVKTLAKMSKDKSPVEGPMKAKAQEEMNKLMANAELLSNDKYVKGLQAQIKQAEEFERAGGIAGMLKKMLGGSFGPMMSGFRDMQMLFAGFSGEHGVLSMARGNGLLPTMLIDLNAFRANMDGAMAQSTYSEHQMTAFAPKGADGKFFKEVITKNAQGQETKEQVPNGQITLKTAGGKEVKVIPAAGELMAKQQAGQFDQNGKYVPGNIRVPVVTAINEHGASSKISSVILTPAEFARYKQIVDAEGQKTGGSITTLAFQDYTEQDAIDAGRGSPTIQVASVSPATGSVSPAVTLQLNQPPAAAPQSGPGVTDYTLAKDGSVIDRRLSVT